MPSIRPRRWASSARKTPPVRTAASCSSLRRRPDCTAASKLRWIPSTRAWKWACCSGLIGAPGVPAPFSGPVAKTRVLTPSFSALPLTSAIAITVPIEPTSVERLSAKIRAAGEAT
jgi:hypothetical protein